MFNLLFIYMSELFPMVVRNVAMGCIGQATRMGSILVPSGMLLRERLPFMVFAMVGILRALLVSYLPGTLNTPLYDTMAGLEEGEEEKILLK
jgi:OCT family organic cation transporter-like MFS transporter 4/5